MWLRHMRVTISRMGRSDASIVQSIREQMAVYGVELLPWQVSEVLQDGMSISETLRRPIYIEIVDIDGIPATALQFDADLHWVDVGDVTFEEDG